MAEVVRRFDEPPEDVFRTLSHPETYATWVVGASEIRSVEGSWPEPGSTFHHAVGIWPLRLKDRTDVLEADAPRRLVLEAAARPAGRARVVLDLRADGGGTVVRMEEFPDSGPARFVPRFLLDPVTRRRNRESLRRLEKLVRQGR